jgi:hypothetical protein
MYIKVQFLNKINLNRKWYQPGKLLRIHVVRLCDNIIFFLYNIIYYFLKQFLKVNLLNDFLYIQ